MLSKTPILLSILLSRAIFLSCINLHFLLLWIFIEKKLPTYILVLIWCPYSNLLLVVAVFLGFLFIRLNGFCVPSSSSSIHTQQTTLLLLQLLAMMSGKQRQPFVLHRLPIDSLLLHIRMHPIIQYYSQETCLETSPAARVERGEGSWWT